ncbi:protein prenyltransferase alpha subunit repeat protein (macronuclear) [Tetrahymena thermophila SB210]|uniref:Protein prenyltransferase alpha subunit repeat protein n=1 Tax=Tetrahymena thermophila (strain SB210) TaxID=312017 RepID=Q240Z7_TETTS|nr:protein prenyltransferase alpha subunit repeat protein [Tetrahymena thermophila SB210]EAS02267.2 protein prenyltransferase alpha subunit repeat protein [Tetrahymena thermophila SB210]|eukprot:XP_001022512.2 protein prenyltransferase alpha subunit repeat protein [Tetrahymena thermophila SB210]
MNTQGAENQQQVSDVLASYYLQYFQNMWDVEGIDHVPDEIIDMMSPDSLFLIQENQLGMSFTGISLLFSECDRVLKDIKSDNILEDQIYVSEMISKIMLCINGEHPKCCHIRQFLLKNNKLNVEEERHFNEIICKRFKKSSIIWNYRHQIIEKLLQETKIDVNQLLNKENEFIKVLLNKFPRNYHAWTYKINLIKNLVDNQYKVNLQSEVEWVKTYCQNNVHEYSAFNYLLLLMKITNFQFSEDTLLWAQQLKIRYEDLYIDQNPLSEINYSQLQSLNKFISLLTELEAKQANK